jgi:acyl-CoA reductase-like NAD-dependent aldehyde dehydrogenase
MTISPDEPPALPSWINGRAFLSFTPAFVEVRDAINGRLLRRTPVCGAEEAAEAVSSAVAAAPGWRAMDDELRRESLLVWAAQMVRHNTHLAKLIRQESGKPEVEALAEVKAAVETLQDAQGDEAAAGKAFVAVGDAQDPLLASVRRIASVLHAGGVVILKPSPHAPAAAYALAELSERSGIPPGVVSLVQGDETTLEALLAHMPDGRLLPAGDPA